MAKNNLNNWDKQYLWHPFTQMRDWDRNQQIIIEKGEGAYIYDINGKKYLDGVSSLWVNVHGHRKREIDRAIASQLKKIAHSTLLGLGNVPSIELAKKLVEITPAGLNKVFYSDSGSTAVEIALKIAFQYWQQIKLPTSNFQPPNKPKILNPKLKTKFLTLVNAYHGDTVGSVSVGGIDLFHKMYKPLLFKAFKAPSPHCFRCSDNDKCQLNEPAAKSLDSSRDKRRGSNSEEPRRSVSGSEPCLIKLEKIMKKHHAEIAAMIVEPMVQAAAGMLTMPRGYLKAVRQLCSKYNILLICDEVATGFGRTGKMFACEIEGIRPDLMCVAKGMTGGYLPVAATLTSDRIYNAFLGEPAEQKTFFHGHTYTGNPLGCAAAIASIDLFEKDKLIARIGKSSAYLAKRLQEFYQLKHVGDIRQIGMMAGIELVNFPAETRMGHRVIIEARKRGVIIRPLGDVIILMPPLSIKQQELENLLAVTYDSIQAATEKK